MIKIVIDQDEWWPWRSVLKVEELPGWYSKGDVISISEELYTKYKNFEHEARLIQQELRELESLHSEVKNESKTIEEN